MFSVNHLILLLICASLIIVSTILSVKYKLSSRKAAVIFTVICVISEITKDMVRMVPSEFGGYILDPLDIPLHLCSMVVFAMLFIVFTKKEGTREKLISAVTVIGLVAPIFALLIPTMGVAFDKVITYQYFAYHSALMWFALHHIITGQVELGTRAYKRNLGYLSVVILLMLYINSALSVYGVNYYFLRKPPVDGIPILNLNHGWYCYFAVLLLIAYGSVTLIHAPFMIREKKKTEEKQT
ncbi:MAG: YwaF family protein [Clostridiales bacterium]|nr:YwaF family protein [Candidatus Cacconaster stercorequi]